MSIKELLKKIISNKETRHKLSEMLTKKVSDEFMIKMLYRITLGEKLDLNNPIKFNEKLQWYKLFYRNDLMTRCSDKYLVREYVKQKGLANILTPLYEVYDKAEDINFNELPEECFIKCTHNSNGNILWKKENLKDVEKIKKKLNGMLSNNAFYSSREWAYKNIQPRIICEELLKTNKSEGLIDYNFFCFNGHPKLVMYNVGLSDGNGEHTVGQRAVFDENFNPLDIKTSMNPLDTKTIEKPHNFEEMLIYAKQLSEPFPFVRVDFFYVDGVIRFGELTFYSAGGYGKYEPQEWQYKLGEWMDLPPKFS